MAPEKVIDKVKKLLSLAGDNPNESERESAMSKAMAMLAHHNITMAQVDASGSGCCSSEEFGAIVEDARFGRAGPWAKYVWKAVGMLYFCDYCFSSYGKKLNHIFIGREEDVAIAHEIASWVAESLWRDGMAYKRIAGGHNSHLTSFLNAAGLRLHSRVLEIIGDAKTSGLLDAGESSGSGDDSSGESNALVVKDLYEKSADAVASYMSKEMSHVRQTKTRASVSRSGGAAAGRIAADRVQLRKEIA